MMLSQSQTKKEEQTLAKRAYREKGSVRIRKKAIESDSEGGISLTIEEILAGESKNVEFKVQRPKDSSKYMKTVIAFSNGEGGRIVFGVDDSSREVVGIPKEIVFSEIDAITTAISDCCEPVVIPDVYLQSIGDKTIIIAEISAGKQRPYYIKSMGIKDGTYIRASGTSRPAGRDLTAEMYYEDEGRSYDTVIRKDLTVTDEEIAELCRQMKEVAVANAKSKAQAEAIKDVTKNVLLSWGLLAEAEDGSVHPTNGYVYLLGKDEFLSQIQCGMFKGKTRTVFVDKREYAGPLWKQIDDAFQFVLRNIRLGARLEGIYRKDIYELPPDSIRELIINAVMNCSFLQNSHIQVAVYDDRLEITSPGGLMPGVTLDKMKEGYSKIRNRALAHAFSYMNLIEAWGSGIPKLMEAMQEYGLRDPEFCDLEIGFRINLYRKEENELKGSQKGAEKEPKRSQKGAEKELKNRAQIKNGILQRMQENPAITQRKLMEEFELTRKQIQTIIKELQENGIVERQGPARSGKWVVKQI